MAALPPPPGVTPDFETSSDLYVGNAVGQALCVGIASIVFLLRCYVRLGFSSAPRQWMAEDWMISLSFAGLVVFSGLLTTIVDLKGGVNQWNLHVAEAQTIFYWIYINAILYGPFILITKISVLLLYLRVFVPHRRSAMWWIIYIYATISFGFYTAITLVKIFQCNPVERAWRKNIPGKCISFGSVVQASGCFNVISDAFLLLIPIKSVWTLKVTLKRKISIASVFTIGAIAPITAAVGFAIRMKTANSLNQSREQPIILLWGMAEVTTGVICTCLPTLPALLRKKQDRKSSVGDTSTSSVLGRTNSRGCFSSQLGATDSDYFELTEPENPEPTVDSRAFADGENHHSRSMVPAASGITRTVQITQTQTARL